MKKLKTRYENLIIGFGKGGKTLAAYLAQHGHEVVLIEQSEKMYGGTCINIACIPSKSLVMNARKGIPYPQAIEEKDNLTSALREKNYDALDSQDNVTIITGKASFASEREVRVATPDASEPISITADRIFINTGAEPRIPPIAGVEHADNVFTSTSIMNLSELPKKLVIVGGGFIGLEFADMFARYGSAVIILDQQEQFLPREDRDIADEIQRVFHERGIRIINSASVEQIDGNPNGAVRFSVNGAAETAEASAVLLATGRKPNTEGLNLAAAGIDTDDRGFIRVNDKLQTNVENIWAIGDINGGPQFTYISLDDFRIIRDQLFDGDYTSRQQRKAVASSIFITPTLAHIGLRENEACERGLRIRVAKLPAASIPMARILNETQGLLKSVIDADTDRILGCTLFCAQSSEMINTIQVAMNAGLAYQTVRDTVFTHPSMTEAFNDLYGTV